MVVNVTHVSRNTARTEGNATVFDEGATDPRSHGDR